MVYVELKRIAVQKMASEAAGHTLQPTALVHEAWLSMVGGGDAHFANPTGIRGLSIWTHRRTTGRSKCSWLAQGLVRPQTFVCGSCSNVVDDLSRSDRCPISLSMYVGKLSMRGCRRH